MPNIQDVNIDKFILQYLPPFLRTERTFLFLHSLLYPLQYFRNKLTTIYFPLLERKARYNSQVIVFEKLLNDTFATTGIFINTSSRIDRIYTFNEIEDKPLYFYNEIENKPLYLGNKAEYNPKFDFTVNTPRAVYDLSLDRLKGMIEKYKLVGVNYNIIAY